MSDKRRDWRELPYGTIKTFRYNGTFEDAEALSDVEAPLVITRVHGDTIAITHKLSGKKVYLPSSLASARIALPDLLKLTDWSVMPADLEKNTELRARVEAVQDAADKQLEDEQ